jgi:hypothetical protein
MILCSSSNGSRGLEAVIAPKLGAMVCPLLDSVHFIPKLITKPSHSGSTRALSRLREFSSTPLNRNILYNGTAGLMFLVRLQPGSSALTLGGITTKARSVYSPELAHLTSMPGELRPCYALDRG